MMQFNPPDVVDGRHSSFSNMNNNNDVISEADQQRMMQFNPPDVVDGRHSSFSNTNNNNDVISRDIDQQRRYDRDVTPDLVKATEPTYMNENVTNQEQPSYANGNILKNEENRQQSFNILNTPSYDVDNFDTKTNENREDHHENVSRRTRSQSVQPISSEPLHGKANFQAKRFNTTVKSPRAERARSERG